jgi:hypothetical protein
VSRRKNIDTPETLRRARNASFLPSDNRTGLRGVYKHGAHGWRAMIGERGRLIHLGTFPTPELAAEAYALAAERRAAEKLARAQARAGNPKEIARRVVELIRIGMACPRAPIDREEAKKALEDALEIVPKMGMTREDGDKPMRGVHTSK